MDTIVSDIAKNHMERDFNEALRKLGLTISEIEFDDSLGLSIILEILVSDEELLYA
ncbi:MAG: hypothetical protein ACOYEI_01460 [Acetivibrionales bacterium]|jgi:hypothetical protein|nr:hypothetical protein [Clostridiaceae bacterium]